LPIRHPTSYVRRTCLDANTLWSATFVGSEIGAYILLCWERRLYVSCTGTGAKVLGSESSIYGTFAPKRKYVGTTVPYFTEVDAWSAWAHILRETKTSRDNILAMLRSQCQHRALPPSLNVTEISQVALDLIAMRHFLAHMLLQRCALMLRSKPYMYTICSNRQQV